MKLISWNLNSRSNNVILKDQVDYLLSKNLDVISLQEVTKSSLSYLSDAFKHLNKISSFELSEDTDELKGKRKYGEMIISKFKFKYLDPYRIGLPFPERVLSVVFEDKGVELLTTHIPPGSSNGVIKVKHFEALYDYLAKKSPHSRIVTGDFNSPKAETTNGEIVTWGQKINNKGEIRLAINSKWKDQCTPERWDSAERKIIDIQNTLDMKDAFRDLHSYKKNGYSWKSTRKDIDIRRRYDHVFCSNSFKVNSCDYDHTPREQGLSDHAPIICEIECG